MKYIFLIISFSVITVSFLSCEKENQEELSDTCGTLDVSFAEDVSPILNSNCTQCHNGQAANGGVQLHNYENVKIHAENGSLLGSIKHESGFSNMPQGQDKLPECNIAIIEAWINDGALDN